MDNHGCLLSSAVFVDSHHLDGSGFIHRERVALRAKDAVRHWGFDEQRTRILLQDVSEVRTSVKSHVVFSYGPTFAGYLNRVVAPKFDPPLNFTALAVEFDDFIDFGVKGVFVGASCARDVSLFRISPSATPTCIPVLKGALQQALAPITLSLAKLE